MTNTQTNTRILKRSNKIRMCFVFCSLFVSVLNVVTRSLMCTGTPQVLKVPRRVINRRLLNQPLIGAHRANIYRRHLRYKSSNRSRSTAAACRPAVWRMPTSTRTTVTLCECSWNWPSPDLTLVKMHQTLEENK